MVNLRHDQAPQKATAGGRSRAAEKSTDPQAGSGSAEKLAFDPMPDRIEPCLALLKRKPPRGNDWTFEIKWDGYRLAIHVEPSGVRLLTRGGHDWTHRFPAIAKAAEALGPTRMILDGEAVVLDEEGRSDFGLLQRSLGGSGKAAGKAASHDAIFNAFDLLYLDGQK